jgi:hypothetical protein
MCIKFKKYIFVIKSINMMILLNFLNSISIIMISWAIGGSLNVYLSTKYIYKSLYSVILVKNDENYKYLGLSMFSFFVTKTFYAKFNTIIKFKSGNVSDLEKMKREMINSEVGHVIGLFAAQLIILIFFVFKPIIYWMPISFSFFIVATIMNILHNLYPILLQQKNRLRIQKIISNKNSVSNSSFNKSLS